MTKKEIIEWYKDNFGFEYERIVDMDIWEDPFDPYDMYANVITVSQDHTVRKTLLRKRNNKIIIEFRTRID